MQLALHGIQDVTTTLNASSPILLPSERAMPEPKLGIAVELVSSARCMTDARQAGILAKRRRFAPRKSDSMDPRPSVTAAASLLLILAFSFVLTAARGRARRWARRGASFSPAPRRPPSSGSGCGSSPGRIGKTPRSARANCRCSRPEARCFSWSSRPSPFALGSSKMSLRGRRLRGLLGSHDEWGERLPFARHHRNRAACSGERFCNFWEVGSFIALMICLLPHGQGQSDGFWMPDGPNWEASRLRRVAPRVLGVYAALTAAVRHRLFRRRHVELRCRGACLLDPLDGWLLDACGLLRFLQEDPICNGSPSSSCCSRPCRSARSPCCSRASCSRFSSIARSSSSSASPRSSSRSPGRHLALAGLESGWVGLRHAIFDVVSRITTTGFEAGRAWAARRFPRALADRRRPHRRLRRLGGGRLAPDPARRADPRHAPFLHPFRASPRGGALHPWREAPSRGGGDHGLRLRGHLFRRLRRARASRWCSPGSAPGAR